MLLIESNLKLQPGAPCDARIMHMADLLRFFSCGVRRCDGLGIRSVPDNPNHPRAGQAIRAGIVASSLLLASPAYAIPCWVVRQAVTDYGQATAEAWARGKGYTDKQIAEMRKCLRR